MKGRKKTTGRFATRQELCEYIWYLWKMPNMGITQIARFCRVSAPTVSKILDTKEGLNK